MDEAALKQALAEIKAAKNEQALTKLKVNYLGKRGLVTKLIDSLGSLDISQRVKVGQFANSAKKQLEIALNNAIKGLRQSKLQKETILKTLDLTIPVATGIGHLHPLTTIMQELIYLFWQMGYEVVQGPEIEDQWHNFEALNIAPDHPARDMQDTFYLENDNFLPRTHTSSVQIRYMNSHKPPIRIIAPGKVYRNEDEDAKHVWMFQQVEGLVVDEHITLADLKGTLLAMAQGILGKQTKIRLRPSFFPYTEPSVEVDATCVTCNGQGCQTCSHSGWIELLGAGMVHSKVFENVGIDSRRYSGFAFGIGLERLAVIKYQIPDIRELWRPNLKFLEQF